MHPWTRLPSPHAQSAFTVTGPGPVTVTHYLHYYTQHGRRYDRTDGAL